MEYIYETDEEEFEEWFLDKESDYKILFWSSPSKVSVLLQFTNGYYSRHQEREYELDFIVYESTTVVEIENHVKEFIEKLKKLKNYCSESITFTIVNE